MLGSTLIKENDLESIKKLNLEYPERYTLVHLGVLSGAEIALLNDGKGEPWWLAGDPVVYDPDSGFAVLSVSPGGIKYLLENEPDIDETRKEDLKKIKVFVDQNGYENIYEYTTF